eukprot:gene5038-6829_t
MRLFQKLGIAGEMQAASQVAPAYEFRNAAGQILMRYDLIAQGSPSGWAPSYMFHQPSLEVALRRLAGESPHVQLRLPRTLRSFDQDPEGVTAIVDGPEGPETVRARWMVACDGAKSPVREALGIGLDDFGFDEPWLVIDALVADAALLPSCCVQYCHPERPVTCTPLGPGRHRWEFMIVPGDDLARITEDESIARLLAPWGGPENLVIERKAVYRFHGRVARRWREGRVLLAGDAAHLVGIEGIDWSEFAERAAPEASLPTADGSAIAYLQYSSGSTRFPHGVAITHHALLNNLAAHSHNMEVCGTDRCVSWLPWYHDMGLVGCFLSPVANQVSADYLKTEDLERAPREILGFEVIGRHLIGN